MSARSFFDANILVYTDDGDAPAKQARALDLIAEARDNRTGVVSTQALARVLRRGDPQAACTPGRGPAQARALWPLAGRSHRGGRPVGGGGSFEASPAPFLGCAHRPGGGAGQLPNAPFGGSAARPSHRRRAHRQPVLEPSEETSVGTRRTIQSHHLGPLVAHVRLQPGCGSASALHRAVGRHRHNPREPHLRRLEGHRDRSGHTARAAALARRRHFTACGLQELFAAFSPRPGLPRRPYLVHRNPAYLD